MSTELGNRLRDLADDAPLQASVQGLWRRGMRQRRRRRAAGALAAIAAVLVVGGGIKVADDAAERPPASPTPGVGHIPKTVYRPSPWSAGTDKAGELGPLSVIGWAQRRQPKGLTDAAESLAPYGVSAIDGTVRFLDIPELSAVGTDGGTIAAGIFARLSPDGRKVAFMLVEDHTDDNADRLGGWAVYDTVSGKVTHLDDPDRPRQETPMLDLAFTQDSRYLITSYTLSGAVTNRSDALVAWDLETGERTVLEEPGRYWLPNVGSGPGGAVWSQGKKTFTRDPAAASTSTLTTPRDVVAASIAPDGIGFAYFGGDLDREGISVPWSLYVGKVRGELRLVPGLDSGTILGWRDDRHVVVVGRAEKSYAVVDIVDGSVESGSMAGDVNLNTPTFASGLWANDLVPGVRPPQASDPRWPARGWAAGAGAIVLAALVVARRRRHV